MKNDARCSVCASHRRQSARSVVVVFTDGVSTRGDPALTPLRARELREQAGAEIFVVSLDTHDKDAEALNAIATNARHVLQVSTSSYRTARRTGDVACVPLTSAKRTRPPGESVSEIQNARLHKTRSKHP